MDNIIFEDPSKQRPRLKRGSQVQPVEVMPDQNGPTYGEQQRGLPSPGLGACVVNLGGLGGLSGESSAPSLIIPFSWPLQESDHKQEAVPPVSMVIKAARPSKLLTGWISTLLVPRHLLWANLVRWRTMIGTLSMRPALISGIVCFRPPNPKSRRMVRIGLYSKVKCLNIRLTGLPRVVGLHD